MNPRLSTKILRPDFQGEFTASILAAAASPDLISFAGGLPNPVSFPVEAMDKATHKVLEKNGVMALQYSGTQGYLPLREWVAKRYETMGVYGVTADDIIITNGSQQVLTMIGACMLDPGDKIIVENPTYLVALQSFHFFDPEVLPVTINPDGIDCDELAATVQANPDVKFAYVIPNFQNPTGLSTARKCMTALWRSSRARTSSCWRTTRTVSCAFPALRPTASARSWASSAACSARFPRSLPPVCASAGCACATRRCAKSS